MNSYFMSIVVHKTPFIYQGNEILFYIMEKFNLIQYQLLM
jgi:hypothetical protein